MQRRAEGERGGCGREGDQTMFHLVLLVETQRVGGAVVRARRVITENQGLRRAAPVPERRWPALGPRRPLLRPPGPAAACRRGRRERAIDGRPDNSDEAGPHLPLTRRRGSILSDNQANGRTTWARLAAGSCSRK
ncbi:hypothetical protein J2S22_003503 [Rhodoplanes tepidamans]|nr:hypothetical protein [Rhodoplanes tepidamans]